ncbi:MAG: LysM peptidoglycan-binding domain-containing protein [Victivallaceae bacterium]|nr:LysM peptidoglycan-binding domain-containing protein [Victivallaceae bacterium]
MKSYTCLTALALLIAAAGCAPRLAETPLGTEEKRWESYIKKSYPAWKAPQTIPPVDMKGKIESPAAEVASGKDELKSLPIVKDETVIIEDVVVKDKKGKVLSESITAVDAKEEFKVYVVQKNDTLWKISTKLYKDGAKWKKIQAANKDVLKGSDKVLPGMTLRIPLP